MKITIKLDTSNAAFEDDLQMEVYTCVTRALRHLEIRLGHSFEGNILDSNGNKVGTIKGETDDQNGE